MPKPTKPLYEWERATLQESAGDGTPVAEHFYVYSNGRYEDYTRDANGVETVETGKISRAELKQLDALIDTINQEPNDGSYAQFGNDGLPDSEYAGINNVGSGRSVYADNGADSSYYYTDQYATARDFYTMMETLDSRYGYDVMA
jgi:hypothetical protein